MILFDSLLDGILPLNCTLNLSAHCHSPFLSFNVFGRAHNRPAKIIFCRRVSVCDSGPESGQAKFYRLQLRLQLQPKQSTPTDPNSGLDSNSAALVMSWFESILGNTLACRSYHWSNPQKKVTHPKKGHTKARHFGGKLKKGHAKRNPAEDRPLNQ